MGADRTGWIARLRTGCEAGRGSMRSCRRPGARDAPHRGCRRAPREASCSERRVSSRWSATMSACRTLLASAGAPLPGLLERAAVLCSGRLPTRRPDGTLAYESGSTQDRGGDLGSMLPFGDRPVQESQ